MKPFSCISCVQIEKALFIWSLQTEEGVATKMGKDSLTHVCVLLNMRAPIRAGEKYMSCRTQRVGDNMAWKGKLITLFINRSKNNTEVQLKQQVGRREGEERLLWAAAEEKTDVPISLFCSEWKTKADCSCSREPTTPKGASDTFHPKTLQSNKSLTQRGAICSVLALSISKYWVSVWGLACSSVCYLLLAEQCYKYKDRQHGGVFYCFISLMHYFVYFLFCFNIHLIKNTDIFEEWNIPMPVGNVKA